MLTHNPGMFHVWGVNAGQMSLIVTNPAYLDYLAKRYAAASTCIGISGATSRMTSNVPSVATRVTSGLPSWSGRRGNATSGLLSTASKRQLVHNFKKQLIHNFKSQLIHNSSAKSALTCLGFGAIHLTGNR